MFLPAANRMRRRTTRRATPRSRKRKPQQTRRRRSKPTQRGGQQSPPPTLSITYPPQLQVAGQQLTMQQTALAPTLTFSFLDPNTTYAFVMHDPDAPNPSYIHWAIKDITAANSEGITTIDYQGPNPPPYPPHPPFPPNHPPHAPIHHYIFTLFVQPQDMIFPEERTGFDATALPEPVATHQFTVESPLAH